MGYAVLFPGQGSQTVGMGERLFEDHAELLGDIADEVLGWSLREACLNGPTERLTRTDIAQPALFALSFVAWHEWHETVAAPPEAAAGHSLGEYTALAAAGALDFATGLRLVAARGKAMAAAAEAATSGMAAVMGAEPQDLERIAEQRRGAGGQLWVANLNAPGQIVMAGGETDIAWLTESASELGLRRIVPLEVAGAFHTPLMAGAAEAFAGTLDEVGFGDLSFEVWANADAAPYGSDIAATLLRQLTSPVRFADSLAGMGAAGIDRFVHLGPGNVTAGMAKRSVPGSTTAAVADADGLDEAVAKMGLSVQ